MCRLHLLIRFSQLTNWKDANSRKVLLVRGARQVGKTYIIRELSKSFDHFLEINFLSDMRVHTFFNEDINIHSLTEQLSVFYNIPIQSGKTLLFLDEIQECPDALSALRFFYEKMPNLHVIAAGSLVEFALSKIPSFGVGRIQLKSNLEVRVRCRV